MSYISGKYHVLVNGKGYTISQNRNGVRYYQKKRAPTFVSKFGSGDSSYRDGTYWQYFAQSNWRNGSKQLKFDDPGRFWKSSDVNPTDSDKLTLSKKLVSAGQTTSGIDVNVIESWRADGSSAFGDGSDGALTISSDTTEAPIDSSCSGTSGTTSLTATNASFAANQKILIHQSRGTGVGQWELNTIASYTAGTITTTDPLSYTYTDSGSSQAQVRVMKQYSAVTIDSTKTYTAKAWDGNVGGILGFYCNGTVTVTGTITATGKGFRGASNQGNYSAGNQGEGTLGIGSTSTSANGSAGGGGAQENDNGGSGGGGGNGTSGTTGQLGGGDVAGGVGGGTSGTASLSTAVFGGGGGSSGSATGSPGYAQGPGGNGGGLIFLIAKTITVTGGIQNNGSSPTGGPRNGGGGGAGGSTIVKTQTITMGTSLVTASAGSGGVQTGPDYNHAGGAGGVGRIHIDYLTSVSGTTTPTLDSTQDGSLSDSAASTTSTAYAGTSGGKIYSWDNATTWTEVYDARVLTNYETGNDTDKIVGDTGGTETAQAQGFQIATTTKVKGVSVYLKKNAGTPGDITVRIETNNAGVPSGTLANANATGTIPAFTTSSYGWINLEFNSNFSLTGTTQYWLVLKTAAAANDQNYAWASDGSSPTYSSGTMAASTDGGSTWSAVAAADAYFRIKSNATQINCSTISSLGGTKKMYFGTGEVTSTDNGDARIISFDGTNWAINKTFTTAACVLSMKESAVQDKVFIGTGTDAIVYETADFSTYTSSDDIEVPQNPGYPYAMLEYNSSFYVGGGSPELVPTQYYNGFLRFNNTVDWDALYPFDFTVIKSLEFYDSFMFIGTYHGQIYLYDTSSLSPLFNFKEQYGYQVQIQAMKYFDDKLYFALCPQDGTGETNVGIWMFDRRGLHLAHTVSGVTNYKCFAVVNGTMLVGTGTDGYVYKLSTTEYPTTGYYQSSYYDANLPSIPKLYKEVVIRHDPLVSGQSITVWYKFKESDSWTQLTTGVDNSVGSEEQTLSFAAGITSKKISLKVVLNGGGTNTPTLTEVVMQYSLYPEFKWQWNMRLKAKKNLKLADDTTDSRSASTIRSELEALMETETLYTFVDIDGTSYSVLVNDIDQTTWVINPDDVSEDEIVLNLLEA